VTCFCSSTMNGLDQPYHASQVYQLRQKLQPKVGSSSRSRRKGSKTERVFRASTVTHDSQLRLQHKKMLPLSRSVVSGFPRPPESSSPSKRGGSMTARLSRRGKVEQSSLATTNRLLSRDIFALSSPEREMIWDEWDEDDAALNGAAVVPYDNAGSVSEEASYSMFPTNIARAFRVQARASRTKQRSHPGKKHPTSLTPFDYSKAAKKMRGKDHARYALVKNKASRTRRRHFKREVARKTNTRLYNTLLKPMRETRSEKADRQLIAGSTSDYTDYSMLLVNVPAYRQRHLQNVRETKIFKKYLDVWKRIVVSRPREFYQKMSPEDLHETKATLMTNIVKTIKRKRAAKAQHESKEKQKELKEQERLEREERQRIRDEKRARDKAIAQATDTALQRERAEKATKMLQERMEAERAAAEYRDAQQKELVDQHRKRLAKAEEARQREREKYLQALTSASKQYQIAKSEESDVNVMASNDPLVLAVKSSKDSAEVESIIKSAYKTAQERFEYVNRADKNGSTLIYHCAWNGTHDILHVLLKYKASVSHVNLRGNLALHLACERSKSKVIEMLVMNGSELDRENSHHKRPYNMFQGDDETRYKMLQLMQAAANRFLVTPLAHTVANIQGYRKGLEALDRYAAKKRRALKAYYDALEPVTPVAPKPALILELLPDIVKVCDSGDAKAMQAMLAQVSEAEAADVVNCTDDMGASILTGAVARGFADVAAVLLGFKANIDATNSTNNTALHYACQHGDSSCIKLLLSHKASPVIQNDKGKQCYEMFKSFPDAELAQAKLFLEISRSNRAFPLRTDIQKMKNYVAAKHAKQQQFSGMSDGLQTAVLPQVMNGQSDGGIKRKSIAFDPLVSSGLNLMLTDFSEAIDKAAVGIGNRTTARTTMSPDLGMRRMDAKEETSLPSLTDAQMTMAYAVY
jgi:ankyrin repeat protein